jgi:hypothetical protein
MFLFYTYNLISLLIGSFQVKQPITVLPELSCSNLIIITGTTNINSFVCYYKAKDEQLIVMHDKEGQPYSDSKLHQINLPLKDFDMDNEFMKSDFMDLMKSDTYPDLMIGVLQKDLAGLNHNNDLNVTISLAGVTKSMAISCSKSYCSGGDELIIGSRQFELSDFGIVPHNYFGFIKIRNEIFINFEFIISQ